MHAHPSAEAELPPLSIFGARSFWLIIVSIACGLLKARGIDVAAAFGVPDAAGVVDLLMPFASLLVPLLAWRERLRPARRLVFFGSLK